MELKIPELLVFRQKDFDFVPSTYRNYTVEKEKSQLNCFTRQILQTKPQLAAILKGSDSQILLNHFRKREKAICKLFCNFIVTLKLNEK